MLTKLEDLPEGVIGFEAHGKLTAKEYEMTLIPEALAALEQGDVRLLFILGDDFAGFELGAVWDDTMFGLREHFVFDRIAIITASSVLAGLIHSLAFLIPGDVHVFKPENIQRAMTWLLA